ncbi:MAG: DUF2157 domain-containing protein [Hyphomonadaceae bacterium]|nr:DUF2157 domain-containing protein [Hyphomonadaceae bacterium]
MASYKEKVARDLERWIASGLVAPDKRDAILATLPDARRLDAATALAWIGGALLGIAIIAFIAANWDGVPRIARFALLIAFFASACGAAAWAAHKRRTLLADIALTVAALIFAAAIGLTGQIFDIVGSPQAALYAAGVAGMALALAGRSVGAAIATMIFVGFGDFQGAEWFDRAQLAAPWLVVFAPLGVVLALRWSSAPLAHASAIGMLFALFWFIARFENESALALFFSVLLAGAAYAARWLSAQHRPHASVFYGWATWGALMFFAIAGYADSWRGDFNWGLPHRVAWLAASGATIALGRFDRHALVTAVGVLSFMGAIAALLTDLGLDLMSAAAVFFVCALAALVGGLMLRRKGKAS